MPCVSGKSVGALVPEVAPPWRGLASLGSLGSQAELVGARAA